ncbi:MAG: hypothetical protein LW826_06425 [Candidatus Jidaibacter sp.]|jgi:hypothetical protein|nr:hypothetical protein [Candidatus Jidaibacter sp.]
MIGKIEISVKNSALEECSFENANKKLIEDPEAITSIKIEYGFGESKLVCTTLDFKKLDQLLPIFNQSKGLHTFSISVAPRYTFLKFLNVHTLNTAVESSTSLTYANYPAMSQKAKITITLNRLRTEGKNLLLECIEALEASNYNISSLKSTELQTLSTNLADINKCLQDCNKNSISLESVQDAIAAKNTNSTSSYAFLMGFAAISAAVAIKAPNMLVHYVSQIQDFHIPFIEI